MKKLLFLGFLAGFFLAGCASKQQQNVIKKKSVIDDKFLYEEFKAKKAFEELNKN